MDGGEGKSSFDDRPVGGHSNKGFEMDVDLGSKTTTAIKRPTNQFQVGDLVDARGKGKLKYAPGKIIKITERGYYFSIIYFIDLQ